MCMDYVLQILKMIYIRKQNVQKPLQVDSHGHDTKEGPRQPNVKFTSQTKANVTLNDETN